MAHSLRLDTTPRPETLNEQLLDAAQQDNLSAIESLLASHKPTRIRLESMNEMLYAAATHMKPHEGGWGTFRAIVEWLEKSNDEPLHITVYQKLLKRLSSLPQACHGLLAFIRTSRTQLTPQCYEPVILSLLATNRQVALQIFLEACNQFPQDERHSMLRSAKELLSHYQQYATTPRKKKEAIYAVEQVLGALQHSDTYLLGMRIFANQGDPNMVKQLFHEMREGQHKIFPMHYRVLLFALADDGQAYEVRKLLDEFEQQRPVKPQVYEKLVGLLAKAGKSRDALALLASIPEPTERAFCHLIRGNVASNDWKLLQHVYSLMEECNIKPTLKTFQSIVEGYCNAGRTQLAVDLLAKSDSPVTLQSIRTIIKGFISEGAQISTEQLFNTIRQLSEEPPDSVCASLLFLYASFQGDMKCAESMRSFMQEQGIPTKISVYNILLQGYFRLAMYNEVHTLLAQMRLRDIRFNRTTHAILITNFADAGRHSDAESCLKEMMRIGKYPLTPSERRLFSELSWQEGQQPIPSRLIEDVRLLVPRSFDKDLLSTVRLMENSYDDS